MFRSPSADEIVERGRRLHEAGKFAAAEALYRQVLTAEPHHANALHLLGVLAFQHKQNDLAQKLILAAIEQNPREPTYLTNLGEVLRAQKLNNAALEANRQALALDPQWPDALNNSGKALFQLERLEESEQSFLKALAVFQQISADHPELAHIWNNLGSVYEKQGHTEKARQAVQKALSINPNMDNAWHNLGTMCGKLLLFDQAEEAYRKSLQFNPKSAQTYRNMGLCMQRRGDPQQAITAFEAAIKLQPDHAEAHWNLGMALLLAGDYPRGWQEYECRWKFPQFGSPVREFKQPLWKGEDLRGKTILLHTEQAYGDAIQFARYISLVAQRGPKAIVVECQESLVRLFQSIPEATQVLARYAPLPPVDFQVPFLSLPLAFHTTLETIPNKTPYLWADPKRITGYKDILDSLLSTGGGAHRRIGLTWAGSANHHYNQERSIPFSTLAPLFEIEDASFVSLQAEPLSLGETQRPKNFIEMHHYLSDFAETAALIANLDLVIAVDTSVAHLAGALGKSVFLLLPAAPDWRWLLEREDSPWYPEMRLFRQKTHGDWAGVVEEVAAALRKLEAGSKM